MTRRSGGTALGLLLGACGPQGKSDAALRPDTEPTAAATPVAAVGADAAADPVGGGENGSVLTDDGQAAGGSSTDRSNRTGAAVLGRILTAAGTIDGERITRFELKDRCHTAFTTARGTTVIDWTGVGNFAGRTQGSERVIDVDDGSRSHAIGVPEGKGPEPLGDAGARVDGGLSVVADSCQS